MAASWAQTVTPWSTVSPSTSGAFTPSAGSALIVIDLDTAATGRTLTCSGTGSFPQLNPPGAFNDANGNSLAMFTQLNCSGGSQTITVTSSTAGDLMASYAWEYSSVSSIDSGGAVSRATPGTGTGAIVGTAQTVATGDILLAYCQDVSGTGTAITSPSGTNRGSGVNETNFCVTEYAGAGGSITPSFTSSSGGTDNFDVMQLVIHATAISSVPPQIGKSIYIMP
jgi:hypothetical protein